MKKNNLPKYWCVQNDGSQLFKDTVIKYISNGWSGLDKGYYYGYNGGKYYNGFNVYSEIGSFSGCTLLTIQQFIEMSKEVEEWTPKRGELVEVSDGFNGKWSSRIYVTTIEGTTYPYACVDKEDNGLFNNGDVFKITLWTKIRQIKPTHKEVTLQEIAEKFGVEVSQLRIKD